MVSSHTLVLLSIARIVLQYECCHCSTFFSHCSSKSDGMYSVLDLHGMLCALTTFCFVWQSKSTVVVLTLHKHDKRKRRFAKNHCDCRFDLSYPGDVLATKKKVTTPPSKSAGRTSEVCLDLFFIVDNLFLCSVRKKHKT